MSDMVRNPNCWVSHAKAQVWCDLIQGIDMVPLSKEREEILPALTACYHIRSWTWKYFYANSCADSSYGEQLWVKICHINRFALKGYLSCIMRKLDFCLCSYWTADLLLCFRFTNSTFPLLLVSKISSF